MLNICNLAVLTTARPQTRRCPASADLRSPTPAGSPWATSDRSGQPITLIQNAADKANASRHGLSVNTADRVQYRSAKSKSLLLALIPFSVAVSSACREIALKLKEQELEACACFLTRLSPVAV